jgi:Spy/CpxP family protein refolding chaperone
VISWRFLEAASRSYFFTGVAAVASQSLPTVHPRKGDVPFDGANPGAGRSVEDVMFGFVIGTLSLVGLLRLMRGGGWRGGYGRWGGGRWGGGPRRWMQRRLFELLDTTPGQEKVLDEVLDEVEKKAWAARDQFRGARGAYARAVRGEHFDGAAVSEAFDAQQVAVEELKKTLREGLAKVHEALRPEQRARLADLIEHGPRGMYGHGCHGHMGHRDHFHGWREARGGGPQGPAVQV